METTYYTLTAREIVVEGAEVQQACGGSGRRLVCVRKAPETRPAEPAGKVIDLAAWRADREAEEPVLWEPAEGSVAAEACGEECCAALASRKARSWRGSRSALGLEILASLSVTAVALVLLVQTLGTF